MTTQKTSPIVRNAAATGSACRRVARGSTTFIAKSAVMISGVMTAFRHNSAVYSKMWNRI